MRVSIFFSVFLILFSCEKNTSSGIEVSYSYSYEWEKMSSQPEGVKNFSKNDDIHFISDSIGWAMASGLGEIYKTIDGGNSWTLQLKNNAYFRSIAFFDENVGFAGNLMGKERSGSLYKTEDGGKSWVVVAAIESPLMDGICGISIANSNTVYASGRYTGSGKIAKSSDRGKTWEVINLEPALDIVVDCYFWHADSGIVVGGTGRNESDRSEANSAILTTYDGGKTWQERYRSDRKNEWAWKISFNGNIDDGYVSIQSFLRDSINFYLKTKDKGKTWVEQSFITPSKTWYSTQAIGFIDENNGWLGSWRASEPALQTDDGGKTWTESIDDGAFNRIRFLNNDFIYATGNSLYRLKRNTTRHVN